MNTLVVNTETTEHRDFKFGSKTEGKYQKNSKMFQREYQTVYMDV